VLRVGLTGGIACGKSHVLRRLASHGFHTLDLDAVSREATAPGSPALAEIASAFGAEALGADGALDRARLGSVVFADEAARSRLNAIVHPRVRAAEARWAAAFAGEADAVLVTDAALLVEAGAHLRFDRLVVVWCSPEEQMARLRERDGLDEPPARARLEAQMPVGEKRAFAHHEVATSGAVADTDRAADAVAAELGALARARPAPRVVEAERLLGGLVHGPQAGPRGLSPRRLLEDAAEAGGLELERLARILVPPAPGPWYRAATGAGRGAEPDAPAAHLAVAVAAWALRRGGDAAFLAAAAGSVARLTHVEAEARGDAVQLALVAREVALASGRTGEVERWAKGHRSLAARFGGAPPSGRLAPVWAAVRRCPGDPAAAAAACSGDGGDGALAAALAGTGVPVEPSPLASALRAALEAIPAVAG
jgi:dephospho-CoA kinase